MIEFDENLEQLNFFGFSSQSEKTSQEQNGAEEKENEISSKDEKEPNDLKSSLKKEDNFDGSNKAEEGCLEPEKLSCLEESSCNDNKNFTEKAEEEEKILPNSKFKSVKELCKAYDNLQSDYTRKCQALAKMQKEIEDNKEKSLPLFETSLLGNMEEFLKENSDAKDFKDEIVKMILSDNRFLKSKNPLNEAWQEYKSKNFVSKKALMQDEEFVNSYILSNDKIREKIVKDYFSNLNLQSSPNLITSNNGSFSVVSTPDKPKSIKEASKLVEDII